MDEQRDIPLVLTLNGTTLLSVSDSTKYKQELKKHTSRSVKTAPARQLNQRVRAKSPSARTSHAQTSRRALNSEDSDSESQTRMLQRGPSSRPPQTSRSKPLRHNSDLDDDSDDDAQTSMPQHVYTRSRPPQTARPVQTSRHQPLHRAFDDFDAGNPEYEDQTYMPQQIYTTSRPPQISHTRPSHRDLDVDDEGSTGKDWTRMPQSTRTRSLQPQTSRGQSKRHNLVSDSEGRARVPQHVHVISPATQIQPQGRFDSDIEDTVQVIHRRPRARPRDPSADENHGAPEGRPSKRPRVQSPPRQPIQPSNVPRRDTPFHVTSRRIDFTKIPRKGVQVPDR